MTHVGSDREARKLDAEVFPNSGLQQNSLLHCEHTTFSLERRERSN